ncbi:glycoside hydrolase family 3 C-terminal domain-containing protein [Kitasatospora sp. NBC_00240]|uniref:glycoside hydrolase family 3 C-terminal domain-containing protein n=1 Tax=Kitasatospora sp. NBC_00240 TaxID=2903567 RepID=UPI002255B44E|nr:glycoside hydrolase family 3 C-terminal domain-containing protein [Kitasatospora sp. NBC_00240]MCX5214705.1 glycoside hydrolase family 3 C-terminal domain-containing protein [Kitasatospora sp. NBC_00240]
MPSKRHVPRWMAVMAAVGLAVLSLPAQSPVAEAAQNPWMNTSLTPAQRADSLLAAMTQAEKLTMLHGGKSCGYVGCVDGNSRLGIPPLHLQDGPVGVGDGLSGVTQLASPVSGAATWDPSLMHKYGEVLGAEQWGKGVNVELGPTVNIVRDPRWGRAFESFGEDPYLAGRIGVADIQGIQSQGPMAQVKHYAAYNQETNRFGIEDNVVVSDRATREIYTPAFEAAVKGGVDSVMCSYNLINGPHACENGPMQNGILKGDMGFTGFITADWGATHSTVASANNGLDMEMPDSQYYGSALTTAVNNGQVSQATLNDHTRRILTSMFRQGLFDKTQNGDINAVVTTADHLNTAKQVAIQGSVLLKNANNVLPFTGSTHNVAVLGSGGGAGAMTQGGGSAGVTASGIVTPYQGLKARGGSGVNVTYAQGGARSDGALPPIDTSLLTPSSGSGHGLTADYFNNQTLAAPAVASRVEPTVDSTWNGGAPVQGTSGGSWSGRWSGKVTPPTTGTYTFSLTSDDGSRLFVNGQKIIDQWQPQASTTRTGTISLTAGQPVSIQVDYYQAGGASNLTLGWLQPGQNLHDQAITAARSADVAVVFANKFESEGSDLGDINLPADQNKLISDVAAVNPNTVVVVNSGSAVAMPWANSVRGIVEAWYPGQEYGNALASLLFGDSNFSGKLPVTFPKSLADVPANTAAQFPGQNNTVQYSEGINVGYRWYDKQNIAPAYPFGFGLSYTTFGYGNLTVGTPDSGGNVAVSFDVTNTGSKAGSEIAQVYVGQPSSSGEPPHNLRGFQRVTLNPGATQRVNLTLDARSFQFWNGSWTTAPGAQAISVGSSSRDLRLNGSVTITNTPATQTGPIKGAESGRCIDVPGASQANSTAVALWDCNNGANQSWTLTANQELKVYGTKCLDVAAGGTADGTAVQIYDCNNTPAQKWTLKADGSIVGAGSGKCLDAKARGTANSTPIQLWTCNGLPNQKWSRS